jgi:hypothetical protein
LTVTINQENNLEKKFGYVQSGIERIGRRLIVNSELKRRIYEPGKNNTDKINICSGQ